MYSVVWPTDNHLAIVSTMIKSLGNISDNRRQVVVVVI